MVANEQVLQRRSSGKPRNHWSPDSSDIEDAKGFGEDDVLVITPLSAQIIASKFQKLSRIPLKKLFQNLKTPLKNVKTHWKIVQWCLSQIPNPTSPQRDVCYKLKTLMREMLSIKNFDENNEELTSFVVWQKTKTRQAINFDERDVL